MIIYQNATLGSTFPLFAILPVRSLRAQSSNMASLTICHVAAPVASSKAAPRASNVRLASFNGMKATGNHTSMRALEVQAVAAAPRSCATRAGRRQAVIEAR